MRLQAEIVGLVTKSETNMRGHWSKTYRRRSTQRLAAHQRMKLCHRPRLPASVLLTRVAPRKLDDDNLRGALKAVRDGVADWLGIDDGDERVSWEYAQEKDKRPRYYSVKVEVRWGGVEHETSQ